MSTTEVRKNDSTTDAHVGRVDMKLEVVVIMVAEQAGKEPPS